MKELVANELVALDAARSGEMRSGEMQDGTGQSAVVAMISDAADDISTLSLFELCHPVALTAGQTHVRRGPRDGSGGS